MLGRRFCATIRRRAKRPPAGSTVPSGRAVSAAGRCRLSSGAIIVPTDWHRNDPKDKQSPLEAESLDGWTRPIGLELDRSYSAGSARHRERWPIGDRSLAKQTRPIACQFTSFFFQISRVFSLIYRWYRRMWLAGFWMTPNPSMLIVGVLPVPWRLKPFGDILQGVALIP